MHEDARRVDHRPQARRAGRQRGDGGVGDLLRLDLAGARPLLRLRDNGFHERATQPPLRLGKPRVGEQHIGAGHGPSRVNHDTGDSLRPRNRMAEADGNRTRQRQRLPLSDFEDRAGHQTGYAFLDHR